MKERVAVSLKYSFSIISAISAIVSVIGFSLTDIGWMKNWLWALLIVFGVWFLLFWVLFLGIGYRYKKEVSLKINGTKIVIYYGDIFESSGMRVIACDTHFDTRVDNIHIEKSSLHGKLFSKLNDNNGIKSAVKAKAVDLKLTKGQDGLYDLPLGTVIRYEDKKEAQIYLLVALTHLDSDNKAKTTWSEYERTLSKMWSEIDTYYVRNDIVIPLLGSGVTRFGCVVPEEELLEDILSSFKKSSINFKSTLKIVLHDSEKKDKKKIQLYKFKHMFN